MFDRDKVNQRDIEMHIGYINSKDYEDYGMNYVSNPHTVTSLIQLDEGRHVTPSVEI